MELRLDRTSERRKELVDQQYYRSDGREHKHNPRTHKALSNHSSNAQCSAVRLSWSRFPEFASKTLAGKSDVLRCGSGKVKFAC